MGMNWWMCYLFLLALEILRNDASPMGHRDSGGRRPESVEFQPKDLEIRISTVQEEVTGQAVAERRHGSKGPLTELPLTEFGILHALQWPSSTALHQNASMKEKKKEKSPTTSLLSQASTTTTSSAGYLEGNHGSQLNAANQSYLPLSNLTKMVPEQMTLKSQVAQKSDEISTTAATLRQSTITAMTDGSTSVTDITLHPKTIKENSEKSKDMTQVAADVKTHGTHSAEEKSMSKNNSQAVHDDNVSRPLDSETISSATPLPTGDIEEFNYSKPVFYSIIESSFLPCKDECEIRMVDTGDCEMDYVCRFGGLFKSFEFRSV